MKTWWPLPFFAQPTIKDYDAPLPIPIVCTLANLLLLPTILITPSVFDTPPSVNKNICLGYPYFVLPFNRVNNGLYTSVPPISAFIFLTYSTELSMFSFVYLTLSPKSDELFDPKLTTLKYESSGKLFIKRISACFAFSILEPPMDPLRSNKKIYSAFAVSIVPYKFFP